MKMFAWLWFELRHIPDFLFSIQMFNGSLAAQLRLQDESEKQRKVSERIADLDRALGAVFLNLDINELRKLADFPDILEALGLYMARSALLYIMGHAEILGKMVAFLLLRPMKIFNEYSQCSQASRLISHPTNSF